MKNQKGTVLYVGKAKNLKARVKQYFSKGGDGRAMIPFLRAQVDSIDTIVVGSEKEALIVENNLIKEHKPKYNAFLKDDKSYIALRVNNKHHWPMVQIVRYRGKPKNDALYFGPYTSAHSARHTLDLLQRLFPLRQCSDKELSGRTRPCILYDMKRCVAPCVGRCTKDEYDTYVDKTVKFLKGNDKEVLSALYEEMKVFADSLEYERADATLKTIRHLEWTLEGQSVDKLGGKDRDIVGIFREGDEVIVSWLFMRAGKLMGSRHYNFTKIVVDDEALLRSLLLQHYDHQTKKPQEILLPVDLPESNLIEEMLEGVKIFCPKRGEKKNLVDMAKVNAEATFRKEKDENTLLEKTLLEMQERFRLTRYPERIECFDNSNIGGDDPVSAMIAFTEGKKDKSRYRKYKMKVADDYGSMYEVLLRRYRRAKKENDLPDLIIVDGGKGQLNVALKVLKELNIISCDLISLVKEEARHDKGLTAEKVFLPNVKDPINLGRTSSILFFLQKVRDEAHRFAITFQKSRRSKKIVASVLDAIPGIGPAKKKALLRTFGSIKQIKNASIEEVGDVPGISKKDAEELKKKGRL